MSRSIKCQTPEWVLESKKSESWSRDRKNWKARVGVGSWNLIKTSTLHSCWKDSSRVGSKLGTFLGGWSLVVDFRSPSEFFCGVKHEINYLLTKVSHTVNTVSTCTQNIYPTETFCDCLQSSVSFQIMKSHKCVCIIVLGVNPSSLIR